MGEWELVAGRLYLLQLEDTDGQDCMPRYFPGFEARVFAHWFDGQIRLAYGQEIEHSRLHYLRLREKEIILDPLGRSYTSRLEVQIHHQKQRCR